mgnify:CR=1 FL=1
MYVHCYDLDTATHLTLLPQPDFLALTIVHHVGNASFRRHLERLPIEKFTSVLILSDELQSEDSMHSDSSCLASLLLIRQIQEARLAHFANQGLTAWMLRRQAGAAGAAISSQSSSKRLLHEATRVSRSTQRLLQNSLRTSKSLGTAAKVTHAKKAFLGNLLSSRPRVTAVLDSKDDAGAMSPVAALGALDGSSPGSSAVPNSDNVPAYPVGKSPTRAGPHRESCERGDGQFPPGILSDGTEAASTAGHSLLASAGANLRSSASGSDNLAATGMAGASPRAVESPVRTTSTPRPARRRERRRSRSVEQSSRGLPGMIGYSVEVVELCRSGTILTCWFVAGKVGRCLPSLRSVLEPQPHRRQARPLADQVLRH